MIFLVVIHFVLEAIRMVGLEGLLELTYIVPVGSAHQQRATSLVREVVEVVEVTVADNVSKREATGPSTIASSSI